MILPHINFQLPSSKTVTLLEIVVKLGQFNSPKTLTLAGLWVDFPESTSYKGHTYQFSASYLQDSDLTYNRSQIGAILPPGALPGGGQGVKFPRSTSYENHKYWFLASYLQDWSYL